MTNEGTATRTRLSVRRVVIRQKEDRVSNRGCLFHKLELREIGELPVTRMLWSSSCRTY